MTDEEIKDYINKICLNIAYSTENYLKESKYKVILIEDIPNIIDTAIKRTEKEERTI